MKKVKIYLIARISKEAHSWNKEVCANLHLSVEVFLPQQHNPFNLEHRAIPLSVVETDLAAMAEADMGLALPEFGCDCAFETGWFFHSGKPLLFFVDDQTEWLRHWMVKGGVDCVITSNRATYSLLMEDEILRHKQVVFISDLRELEALIIQLHQRFSEKNSTTGTSQNCASVHL